MFHVDHQPVEATSREYLSTVCIVETDECAEEAGFGFEERSKGRHLGSRLSQPSFTGAVVEDYIAFPFAQQPQKRLPERRTT